MKEAKQGVEGVTYLKIFFLVAIQDNSKTFETESALDRVDTFIGH